jgi:hypothetical protein
MQKIIQTIAFTAHSDDGLISILMATMDNLEAKLSSTINEYKQSVAKSNRANALYNSASKGKPYDPKGLNIERSLSEIIEQRRNDPARQTQVFLDVLRKNNQGHIEVPEREYLNNVLSSISQSMDKKIWQGRQNRWLSSGKDNDNDLLRTRRYKSVPAFIPGLLSKRLDISELNLANDKTIRTFIERLNKK